MNTPISPLPLEGKAAGQQSANIQKRISTRRYEYREVAPPALSPLFPSKERSLEMQVTYVTVRIRQIYTDLLRRFATVTRKTD